MSHPIMTGSLLSVAPFLEIERRETVGDAPAPIGIAPKLAATPTKIKWSSDKNLMATVAPLRREDLPGIGSPTEVIPDGIRVFSWGDRFLLFGGTAGSSAKLYEKTGVLFQNTVLAADLPDAPDFLKLATFSKGGRWLFGVLDSVPGEVQCFAWSGGDANDPAGVFNLQVDTLAAPGTITALEMTPLNNYLIVRQATSFQLFGIYSDPVLTELVTHPAGRVLAINSDETEWLIAAGATVKTYAFDPETEIFTETQTITHPFTADLGGSYAPADDILILWGDAASQGAPRFYARVGGLWTFSRAEAALSMDAASVEPPIYAHDGNSMVWARPGAVEFFKRDVSDIQPLTYDNSYALYTNRGNQSKDREFLFTRSTGGTYSFRKWGTTPFIFFHAVSGSPGNSTFGNCNDGAVSDAGAQLVIANNGSVGLGRLRVFDYDGTTFTKLTVEQPSVAPQWVDITGDGQYIVTSYTTAPYFEMWKRQPDTSYIKVAADFGTSLASGAMGINFNAQGDRLAFRVGTTLRVLKLDAGSWVPYTTISVAGSTPYKFAFDPSSRRLAVFSWPGSGGGAIRLYDENVASTGYDLKDTQTAFSSATTGRTMAFTSDGALLCAAEGSGVIDFRVHADGTLTGFADAVGSAPTAATQAAFAPDDSKFVSIASVAAGTGTEAYFVSNTGARPVFIRAVTQAVTGGEAWGIAPNGSVYHGGTESTPIHRSTTSPYDAATELVFAPDWTPAEVFNVQYSTTGNVVVFDTVDGLELAIRPKTGGDFVNSKDISGTFVTLYDLAGDTYVERGFIQHVLDAEIRDMTYSDDLKVFAYHVNLPVGAPVDAERGRLIFDISRDPETNDPRYDLRGTVWDANMLNTFIAFSPWGTHFVVTKDRSTADPAVSLHEFTTDYNFINQDEKPVPYGPCDFSRCDDVVVAHGGATPFTFFKHDRDLDVLVPQATTVNWTNEGVILDIAFRDDCSGIGVLTPDDVTVIEPGPDDVSVWEPGPETPIDTPSVPPDTDLDESDDVFEVDPADPGLPPTEYVYDPTDRTVTGINYVPYTCVSVSFRVLTVPG